MGSWCDSSKDRIRRIERILKILPKPIYFAGDPNFCPSLFAPKDRERRFFHFIDRSNKSVQPALQAIP